MVNKYVVSGCCICPTILFTTLQQFLISQQKNLIFTIVGRNFVAGLILLSLNILESASFILNPITWRKVLVKLGDVDWLKVRNLFYNIYSEQQYKFISLSTSMLINERTPLSVTPTVTIPRKSPRKRICQEDEIEIKVSQGWYNIRLLKHRIT